MAEASEQHLPAAVPKAAEAAAAPAGGYFTAPTGGAAEGVAALTLSAAAYRFHLYALTDAVMAGDGGFISEGALAGRGAEELVGELCAVGYWERVAGGYRVLDEESLAVVLATYESAGEIALGCLGGHGHLPDPASPSLCLRCHGAITGAP